MNRFARQAQIAYNEYAPERVDQLDDPVAFFTQLGRDAEEAWANLWPTMLPPRSNPDGDGDTAVEVGRVRAAQQAAEEIIIAEWCVPVDVEVDVDDSQPYALGLEMEADAREVRAELGDPLPQDEDLRWPSTPA